MSDFSKDYIADIIDEIALEGLDGITLEALWVRLSERPRFMFKPTDKQVKKYLWIIVSKLPNVEFFTLPEARPNLFTFNRLEHIDSNGNFYEPEDFPPCIYPHCPIEDKGIMGSCSTYKERENVSQIVRKESYETVERRGNHLIIVANQNTRTRAICSMDFNPLTELGVIQYCILERIGRSRYQGEVTQGKRGLQVVTDDPKMLYYFRKLLVKNKLVTKQVPYRTVNPNSKPSDWKMKSTGEERNVRVVMLINSNLSKDDDEDEDDEEEIEYTLSKEVRDEKTKLLEAISVNTEICDDHSPTDTNCDVPSTNQGAEVPEVLLVEEKGPDLIEDVNNPGTAENSAAKSRGGTPSCMEEIEAEIIIQSSSDRPTLSLTEEMKYLDKGDTNNSLTARMLKRASLIVQSVNILKVIQDFQKIQKIINEEEESEGLKQTVDRKTVQRLLDKLEIDGLVRIIKVNLKGHGKEKNMVFICHPTVNENHSEIQSAIEQAKMKLPIVSAHHTKKSILKKIQDKRLKQPTYKHDVRAGRKYGYKPKFIRMRIFHMYMYYLIYGYEGSCDIDQSCKNDILKQLELDDSLLEEMSTVYRNEIDWKMFLPPLPTHAGIRNSMTGQSVVVESVNTKKELLASLHPKTVEEAKSCDVGYLPGDHLGAAGLDSDMFVHLKRNWYWTGKCKSDDSIHRSMYPTVIKELYNKSLKRRKVQEPTPPSTVSQPPSPQPTEKLKKAKSVVTQSHFKLASTARKSKAISKKKTRIVKQRKTRYARKPYYDQIDKDALSRMVKLRVDWSPIEDNLLLICKVASLYLSPDKRRHVAKNFCAVREVLHSTYPGAIEKLDALLKSQGEGPKGYQQEYDKIFVNLIHTLFKKLKNINNSDNTNIDVSIPGSLAEFHSKYQVVVPRTLTLRYGSFQEVHKTTDILASVVNSVIHIEMQVEFPDQLIVLDPRLSETEESYKLIMKRFREMLSIIKDARQKEKKTLLSEDEFDEDEDEDKTIPPEEESEPYFEQFNLKNKVGVANTASRLALYLMRDEPLEQLDQSLQHAHDYFVLNPCKVTAQMDKTEVENTIFFKENKMKILSDIKRLYTFPGNEVEIGRIIDSLKTDFPEELIVSLLKYLESKGDLGATFKNIKVKFGESKEIVELLSRLVDEQYILKTGVIKVRYVHPKFCKPWLVKSFHLLRHNRENMETFNTNSTYTISFINSDKKKRKAKTETAVDANQSSSIVSEEIKKDEPLAKKIKPNEISSNNMEIDSVDLSNKEDGLVDESCSAVQNVENKRKHEGDDSNSEALPNKIVKLSESLECAPAEKIDFEESKTGSSAANEGNISSINSELAVSDTLPQLPESTTDLDKFNIESIPCAVDTNENEAIPISDPPVSNISCQSPKLASNLESDHCSVETKENSESSSTSDSPVSDISSQSPESLSNLESAPCNVGTKENSGSSSTSDIPILKNSSQLPESISNLQSNLCIVENKENSESSSTSDSPISNSPQSPELVSDLKIFNTGAVENKEPLSDLEKPSMGSNSCATENQENNVTSSTPQSSVSNNLLQLPKPIFNLETFDMECNSGKVGTTVDSESSSTSQLPVSNKLLQLPEPIFNLEKFGVDSISNSVVTTSQTAVSNNSSQSPERTSNTENTEEALEENSRVIMKATRKKWVSMSNENFSQLTKFDASDVKNVNIVTRPWIKVDGNLNRRVLDRMLGSVLGHCLTCPGITVQKLQERFTPALQPVHTFELVEILQRIGCVKLFTMKRSWKCTLFSKRATVSKEPSTGLENPADMLIDTDPLAISKLGYFIGDKNYTIDYLDALTDSKVGY
ncbi:unnamed protein product [Nezara viridula]|uniref:B-block binding subunit of TFIIIC domain-containing protein n=1 Tax=Nezara viridula TaxID=85310 RepID=A0A9P0HKI1_NEZVI|nr:unnamed protein product [Nezara viridula]